MRKYKINIILLLLILANGWTHAQTIAMRIPDTTVVSGDFVDIPIYADSSLIGKNIISYMLQLNFNQSNFQPISVITAGTINSGFGSPAVNTSIAGKISIAGAGTVPLEGKGVFLFIRFKAVQPGGLYLGFSGSQFNYFNEGLPIMSFDDGYINITGFPSISVYPDNQIITKADQLQFYVSGGAAPFLWSVTDTSIASIDQTGMLTGKHFGYTKVVAQDINGLKDTTKLIEIKAMRLSIPTNIKQLQGADVDIPINISDVGGLNISSGNFTLSYYQNILTPIGVVQNGTLLESFPAPVFNINTPGKVTLAFAGTSPLTGSGTLIFVRFKVSTQNTGGSGLDLSNALFDQTFTPTITNGYFSTINLASLTISPNEGTLVAGEAVQFTVNGGGIPPFTWTVSNSEAATISQSGLLTANQSGLLKVSVIDSAGAVANSSNFQVYDTKITMPDTIICPADHPIFYYPVQIESLPTGKSVFSIQGTIEYDSNYIDFQDIETIGMLTEGWTFSINPVAKLIHFAGSGTTSFNSSGTIALLKFALKPNFVLGLQANVYLKSILMNEGDPLPTFNMYQGRIYATVPSYAPTITGINTVCQGQQGITFSVPPVTGATGYVWTLPTGAIIASGNNTNTITVNFSDSATSGYIVVHGTNGCGNGYNSPSHYVTVNTLPGDAGTISGATDVCSGQGNTNYSVPWISNASNYVWTLPSGASISSGTNYSIVVNYSDSAVSGILKVKATNSCGNGKESPLLNINVNTVPSAAGGIAGPDTVCFAQANTAYNIPVIVNAGSYLWSVPTGATIVSGNNTDSIILDFSTAMDLGNISVRGINSCGQGPASTLTVIIKPAPQAAGAISGPTSVLQGQVNNLYSVEPIIGANNYSWILPLGAVGSSTTNTITVDFPIAATSGNISVTGSNSCGEGTASILAVSVNPIPVICEAKFEYISSGPISFTDISTGNPTLWSWDFGDGTFSSEQNPVHSYITSGNYDVTLTIYNLAENCVSSVQKRIIAGSVSCQADFSSQIDTINRSVSFTSGSQNASDYYWDFGDGISSSLENPSHVYALPGSYLVKLSIRNSSINCTDEYSQLLQVGNVVCLAGFNYSVDHTTLSVNFIDNSQGQIDYYYWDFGDGTFSIEANPTVVYKNPGVYMIGQFVIDFTGNCADYISQTVQVGAIDCSADFISYIDPLNYTAYFTNKVLGASSVKLWSFGDGSFSTDDNPIHIFPGAGIYSAGLNTYDFSSGCMDYFMEMLMIGGLGNDCSADFAFRVDPVNSEVIFNNTSIGDIVESIWNFGDETPNSLENSPVHTFAQGGYYNVCLTVTNSHGIKNMGCKWVLVEGNTSNDCLADFMFTIDSSNLSAKFVNNSLGNYDTFSWDFGDNRIDSVSTEQHPGHVYDQKGYYLVHLKIEDSSSGCVSDEYKLLNVADNQVLKAAFGYEAQQPVKKLAGYPVDLVSASSGDGATVEWDFGDKELKKATFTVMDSTSRKIRHYYAKPGTYKVCLRISDPIRLVSDVYCSFVTTKNAIGINETVDPGLKLSVYPNPFVGVSHIQYRVDKPQSVELAIYDQLGRKVETLVNSRKDSGTFDISWEAKTAPPGIYHLKLVTEDGILTRQLVLSR